MRPSIARFGEMPGPKEAYSAWWGHKHGGVPQKGVVSYTLSPYQFKAAPKVFRTYLFNFYRRAWGEALYILIPFGTGYAIYSWANKTAEYNHSKAGHIAALERDGEHH